MLVKFSVKAMYSNTMPTGSLLVQDNFPLDAPAVNPNDYSRPRGALISHLPWKKCMMIKTAKGESAQTQLVVFHSEVPDAGHFETN